MDESLGIVGILRESINQTKCSYLDASSIALHFAGVHGWLNHHRHRQLFLEAYMSLGQKPLNYFIYYELLTELHAYQLFCICDHICR